MVASAEDAGASYEALGGRLTRFPSFGFDPLFHDVELIRSREQQFMERVNVQETKAKVVNGIDMPFREAIQTYMDITRRLLT